MLTTQEASNAIQSSIAVIASEPVLLEQAIGRVLRQAVTAERDQPPFDRVTMDGVAISFAAFDGGLRRFTIQGKQFAGEPQQTLTSSDSCIEIMTGAALPVNCDCVVPVEEIEVGDGFANINDDYQAASGQFIHPQGSDYAQTTVLLDSGRRINATDIAVIASCGLASVEVSRQPDICVISTGDELVAAGQPINDSEIRMSNGPAVEALLRSHGYSQCTHQHLVDDRTLLSNALGKLLGEHDVLVLSGGVSMGQADYVPEVLQSLGVEVVFHKVSQRPGKPLWFGIGPQKQLVFALPGNPVSTLVCARQYVLPALAAVGGETLIASESAVLSQAYTFAPPLTCFLPVALNNVNGSVAATPIATNTSGDFAALSRSDGFIELPADKSEFASGSAWPLRRW